MTPTLEQPRSLHVICFTGNSGLTDYALSLHRELSTRFSSTLVTNRNFSGDKIGVRKFFGRTRRYPLSMASFLLRELPPFVLGALRSNQLYRRPDNYWESVASRYRAMSASQMDSAARAVIDPTKFVWVVVGDASVVRPQLEGLGLPIEVVPAS